MITIKNLDYQPDLEVEYTLEDIENIRRACQYLLKNGANLPEFERRLGICWHIKNIVSTEYSSDIRSYHLVSRISKRWRLSVHPGIDASYPIRRDHEPDDQDLWAGRQLTLRLDLLRYIIKRLNDVIRRARKSGSVNII